MASDLKLRIAELQARQAALPRRMAAIAAKATLQAVDAAMERTPPNDPAKLRGVNMISGELSEHWATDSQTVPVLSGGSFATTLANSMEYASYVNDGHRLDRHFVPGLYIDENGLLSRNLDGQGGMMVGTRTQYIPGRYMKEAGVDKYQDVMEKELQSLAEETLR